MTSPPARPPERIALFTGNYNYTRDGANQTLNRLVRHLQAGGAEVRVYSPTTASPAFEPAGRLISIPSVSLPGRPEYRLGLGMTPAIRREVVAFRPQVIHLSTPDILGFQGLRLARELAVPVVASVHTLFETYLDYYGLGWLSPLVERTVRTFYDGCDRVLAPTEALARQMASTSLGGRIEVWGRGVDGGLFDPARRDLGWRRSQGFADHEVVVLFLGRVVLEKGLGVFADAVDRIQGKGPIRPLVIGDGPAQPWLQDRLPGARFTGCLTGETLAAAVASADIFLNPSATEAFGNVTLEAMAAGLPVVCADLPNTRSLVRNGETGLLCTPGDPDSYASAIERLLEAPELRARLGAAARAASAAFSWDSCLDIVVRVYGEVLAEARERERAARRGLRAAA